MIKIDRPECPHPDALLITQKYKHPINKKALSEASHNKCMYCESKIKQIYPGDVEHIKPKSKFPELEFSWDNLGFCCFNCNNAKNDKFDLNVPFINPYLENPKEFLCVFGYSLVAKDNSIRAKVTILDIDLNRIPLNEHRKEKLEPLIKFINLYKSENRIDRKKEILTCIIELYGKKEEQEYFFFISSILEAEGFYIN